MTVATPKEFVEDLASRLRARLPVGAMIYLMSDLKAQEALRAFAQDVEDGLGLVGVKVKTVESFVAEVKAKKTATMAVLQLHQKSIEEALRFAVEEAEAEARRIA